MKFLQKNIVSYNLHGNVDTLLQDYNFDIMKSTGNRFKKITYNYDLISGKVNAVNYQPGQADEFYHKYYYDAENRLSDVYTSKDALTYERDSRYDYYKHGPLARQIIGQNQVQGFDYAYTLQGWLKGMNSTAVGDGKFDMGADGAGMNAQVARDAFGFALHYYSTADTKDYNPINANAKPFANAAAAGFGFVPLYNGNIAAISMNIPTLGDALLSTYRMDQLNRLVKVNSYKGLNPATNNWNVVAIDDHREEISYDPSGNIQTYKRNGSGNNLNLNNYSYTYQDGTNKLISLKNSVDNKITAYGYDAIGNVIKDEKQDVLNNTWNVYGKLQKVEKKDGKIITYSYDAGGNRITKTVGDTTEIYVRDANGTVLLTYQKNPLINSGNLSTKEFYKYGSNLLGIKKKAIDMQVIVPNTGIQTFVRGEDEYYVYGHNGNIIGTISDKKIQHDDNNDKIIDYYTADVRTATMFSSFGAMTKSFNGDSLLHGFNGQQRSPEISPTAQTAEFWEYNGDVGRRSNVDPRPNPAVSPYAAFENNPILFTDVLGDTSTYPYIKNISKFKYNGTISDNPVENVPNAVGNAVINILNIVPAMWNSGVKNYEGISEGTWSKDVSSELKQGFNNTSDFVANTIDYTIQTPIKQQFIDAGNTLNNPVTLETAVTAVIPFKLTAGLKYTGTLLKVGTQEGIVYDMSGKADMFGNMGKPYIGKADNPVRFIKRQGEHIAENPNSKLRFKIIDRAEPGTQLLKKEQKWIDTYGGPTNKSNPNGGTANRRNNFKKKKS